MRARNSSPTMRRRSAWASSTLSYSGRKRGGAGVSASGTTLSGTSNSSRPASSWNVRSCGRSRSNTSRRPVYRDHVAASRIGCRTERGDVAQHHRRRLMATRRVGGRARLRRSCRSPLPFGSTARAAALGRTPTDCGRRTPSPRRRDRETVRRAPRAAVSCCAGCCPMRICRRAVHHVVEVDRPRSCACRSDEHATAGPESAGRAGGARGSRRR